MGRKCLKCNYERKESDIAPEYECPNCGAIYSKVEQSGNKTKMKSGQKILPPKYVAEYTSDQRINRQLANLGGFDSFFTKREIKYLPQVLRSDETIKGLGSGFFEGSTWLIVVTDQRLLFLDKGMVYGLKQLEMDYGQISAVSHSMGLLLASITVSTSGGMKKIDSVQKEDAPKLSQLISDQIRRLRQPKQPAPSPKSEPAGMIDIASQLERLAALMERGILTPDEFKSQKEKLLNQ